jgi:hypothetical protein
VRFLATFYNGQRTVSRANMNSLSEILGNKLAENDFEYRFVHLDQLTKAAFVSGGQNESTIRTIKENMKQANSFFAFMGQIERLPTYFRFLRTVPEEQRVEMEQDIWNLAGDFRENLNFEQSTIYYFCKAFSGAEQEELAEIQEHIAEKLAPMNFI